MLPWKHLLPVNKDVLEPVELDGQRAKVGEDVREKPGYEVVGPPQGPAITGEEGVK